MTFSAGIPCMYLIGIGYFQFTYMWDHLNIIKDYQKTYVFNQELPLSSMKYIKYAILTNLVFSCYQFFGTHIFVSVPVSDQHFDQIVLLKSTMDQIKDGKGIIFIIFAFSLSLSYLTSMRHQIKDHCTYLSRIFCCSKNKSSTYFIKQVHNATGIENDFIVLILNTKNWFISLRNYIANWF